MVCCQIGAAQGVVRPENLDSLLRTVRDPNKKVDLILEFLEKPENQYLGNALDFASRAFVIAQQNSYMIGKIQAMIKMGNCYFRTSDYKKAMDLAQKAKEMAEDINYEKELANSLNLIGTIYSELDDYDQSSQYLFESLKIFENLGNKEGIALSLGSIGNNFFYQKDYKKAIEYYKNSLEIAIKIDNQALIKKQYNNMGAAYFNNDTAVFFFQKALKISKNLGDKLGQGTNIMNIGYIRMKEKKFTEALLNFRQSLDFAAELDNHLHMARCYLNFGYCYYQAKRIEESIEYFKKALYEGQKNRYYRIIEPASKMLDLIYSERHDTVNAYKYVVIEKLADDSLSAFQKQKLSSKLELQYLYEKKELKRQLAQQAKNAMMLFVIFSLVAGLVILGLVFAKHRLKSKFVVLEKEKISLEKKKIETELDIKNRELTVNLISLIRKNEMFADISKKLMQIETNAKGDETKQAIHKISQDLRTSTDDKMLNEFSLRFQEVHAGFYEKLLQAYPDLSQNELKLCAFLRLNMSTKDIAELTGQQLASIDKARYRLRKKLALPGADTNLVTFLSQV